MNNKKFLTFLLFTGISISFINAQNWSTRSNDLYEKDWSIGAGFNMVDDSGEFIGSIIEPSENWNFSKPFTLSTEYFLNNKFSFNAMMSFNKFKEEKRIDNSYILKGNEASYFAFDLAGKFSFRDIFHSYTFDPYAFLGFGYTKIGAYKSDRDDFKYYDERLEKDENGYIVVPDIGRLTLNTGLGFNYWFSDVWGLNLNAALKFGVANSDHHKGYNSISNQKQYSLGVIYLFPEKVLGRVSSLGN